jgi:hypothetical protein
MDEEQLYQMLCMLLFHRTDRACWDELSFQNNFITELPVKEMPYIIPVHYAAHGWWKG